MSIADELVLLANTKENLRVSLGLPEDVPFSQYAANVPWGGDAIPATGTVFDFQKNRYAKDGKAIYLGDVSGFIRLSSATKWHEGKLVEVQNSIPRISSEGLLIEPQRTNTAINTDVTFVNGAGYAVEHLGHEGVLKLYKLTELETVSVKSTGVLFVTSLDTFSANSFYFRSEGAAYIGTGYATVDGSTLAVFSAQTGKILQTTISGFSTIEKDAIDVGGGFIVNFNKVPGGAAIARRSIYGVSNYSGALLRQNNSYMGDSSNVLVIGAFQCEPDAVKSSSYIPAASSPATRAPDILNIPRLPTQTITGDWDAGVTYTVSGSIATFAGHGHIRNIDVVHNPISPFKGDEKGFWIEPYDTSTLFQNSDGTIPVVDGDPIGLVLDRSGNNYHLTQTVSASRPKLLNGGIVFDKVDDALTLTVPAGGITGTLFLATTRGTASYGVSMPAGVWTLGNTYNPQGNVVSAVLIERVLTEDEKDRLHVFGIVKGGTEFGAETILSAAYRGWTHLVDFPLIDTSSVTNFYASWYGCPRLKSFPVLNVSKGTNFGATWYGCIELTFFPVNFFDNCLATNFTNAFTFTRLSQASIDGILVSINSNGTSNGTFDQSGGSAPSAVGQAAIDAMRSRGWTVTTTGGY